MKLYQYKLYLKNLIKSPLLLIIIFFNMWSSISLGLENVDECKIFKELVIKEKAKLSLDETDWRIRTNFGFILEADDNESDDWSIQKIHPDLYYEYPDDKIEELHHKYVESINGYDIRNIDEKKFDEEWEKDKIKLKFFGLDKTYSFDKKEYWFFPIYVSTNIQNITSINSKKSSFDADIQIKSLWANSKLTPIIKKLYEKLDKVDPEFRNTSFFCELDKNFIDQSEIYIPEIVPINSKLSEKNYEEKIRLDFIPKGKCEDNFGECIDEEMKIGAAILERNIFYQGTFYQKFDFTKFPFDEQTLKIKLKVKERGEYDAFRNIIQSEYGESLQKKNINSFINNEWDFKTYYWGYDYYKSVLDDIHIPFLSLEFDISRIQNYYLLKLMLPIIFLIIITWSVFWIVPKDLESRLTVSVVSFLSLIAYNFVVDQDLPKLGYLTFLDHFVLYSYIFAGVPTLQTVLSRYLYDQSKRKASKRLDKEFRIYYLPSYGLSIFFLFLEYDIFNLEFLNR